MKKLSCSRCGFFFTTRSFLCPDCGHSAIKFFEETAVYKMIVLCSILVLYAYGLYLVFAGKSGRDPEVVVGLAVILIFTVLASVVVFVAKKFIPDAKRKTLTNMQEKITQRMSELQEATQKINTIQELVVSCQNKLGDIAKETLINACTSLDHLTSEYQAKLCEIEILRLLNRFESIRNPLRYQSVQDLTVGMNEIDTLERDCMKMQDRWKSELQSSSTRANECFAKLLQVSTMLNGLREGLIAAQVRRAVQEIRPLRSFHGLEMLDPQIEDQIGFQHQLDTLSAELQVLENENIRLKTEQEVLNTIK